MGRTGRSASGTCYVLGSSHQVCREASFNWGFVEGKGGIVRSRDCPPQVSTSDEAGAPGVARQGRSRLVLCPRVSPHHTCVLLLLSALRGRVCAFPHTPVQELTSWEAKMWPGEERAADSLDHVFCKGPHSKWLWLLPASPMSPLL